MDMKWLNSLRSHRALDYFSFLIYHVVQPPNSDHFEYCLGNRGRLPAPVVLFFLGNLERTLKASAMMSKS